MPAPNLGLVAAAGPYAMQQEIQKMVAERQAAAILAREQAIQDASIAEKTAQQRQTNLFTTRQLNIAQQNADTAARREPTPKSLIHLSGQRPIVDQFGGDPTKSYTLMYDPEEKKVIGQFEEAPDPTKGGGAGYQRFGSSDAEHEIARQEQEWQAQHPGEVLNQAQRQAIRQRVIETSWAPVRVSTPFGPGITADPQRRTVDLQTMADPDDPTKPMVIGNVLGSTEKTAVMRNEQVLDNGQLARQYFDPSMVGPFLQGKTEEQLAALFDASPQMQVFYAARAAIENNTLNLLSGAAVNEHEAERIKKQIPQLTDPENAFRAKLQLTMRNADYLMRRTLKYSGANQKMMPAPIPGVTGPDFGGTTPVDVLAKEPTPTGDASAGLQRYSGTFHPMVDRAGRVWGQDPKTGGKVELVQDPTDATKVYVMPPAGDPWKGRRGAAR